MNEISQEHLHSILKYDKDTGVFTWRKTISTRSPKGSIAGTNREGSCIIITINLRKYRAHRLAWLYMTGKWPSKLIDHIDRNPLNNAWNNLRSATVQQNGFNSAVRPHSKTGFKGVHREITGRYSANATVNGKRIYIGVYGTPEEAHAAYTNFVKPIHGEFHADSK